MSWSSSYIKVLYQGYPVKVKLTGAKSVSVCPVRGWSALDWKTVLFISRFVAEIRRIKFQDYRVE